MKIFVLNHQQHMLDAVPNLSCFEKINLTKLQIGQCQNNLLGEGRAFLSHLDPGMVDYAGFANARWDGKYHRLSTRISQLADKLPPLLSPDKVYAAWPTNAPWLDYGHDWLKLTLICHPSMKRLLDELASFTGMSLNAGRTSLWANDFVCSRQVWWHWLAHWRRCFKHFHGLYGFQLPMGSENMDASRSPAYFYERVTTIYFANQKHLQIVPIP